MTIPSRVTTQPKFNESQLVSVEYLLLVAISAIGLILRCQQISSVSMDFDECCSWKISQFAWLPMFDAISRDVHPPLYYILLKGLTSCLGDSPLVLRGFSIVLGMATIVATGWLVKTAIDPASKTEKRKNEYRVSFSECEFATLLSMWLVATNALNLMMSLQARPYTLGTFLSLLSATLLLRALRGNSQLRDWGLFSVSTICLSLTHYHCLFVVASLLAFAFACFLREFLTVGWSAKARGTLLGIGLFMWLAHLAWFPWLPTFLFQRARSTEQLWMSPITFAEFSGTCFRALASGNIDDLASSVPGRTRDDLPENWVWLAPVIWALIACHSLVARNSPIRLVAICALFPVCGAIAYGLVVRNILGVKYLIFPQVFLLISLSCLTASIPKRRIRTLVTMGLCVWSGYWTFRQVEAHHKIATFHGVRSAVAYLNEHRSSNEPVIVGSSYVHPMIQKYALDPSGIYTRYSGDHTRDILSGPPLRSSEYRGIDRLLVSGVSHIWAIESRGDFPNSGVFGSGLPSNEWELTSAREFREANGFAQVIAVKLFRRR